MLFRSQAEALVVPQRTRVWSRADAAVGRSGKSGEDVPHAGNELGQAELGVTQGEEGAAVHALTVSMTAITVNKNR